MNGLLIVALVCAASTAPAECSRDTALDLVTQPSTSASPTMCLIEGESVIAGGALGRSMAPGTYLKIGCERRKAL